MFFYQNLFGSRVYFDDLGPPWPKHPCTDNVTTSQSKRTRQFKAVVVPKLDMPLKNKRTWIPLRFQKSKVEDSWIVLYFERLDDDSLVRILTTFLPNLNSKLPIYMIPWDTNACSEIEFLDHGFAVQHALGWRYADWFAETASNALAQRGKSAKSGSIVTRKSKLGIDSVAVSAKQKKHRNAVSKGHFKERDEAILRAGYPVLPRTPKERGVALKKLVNDGVLLPDGTPNHRRPKK